MCTCDSLLHGEHISLIEHMAEEKIISVVKLLIKYRIFPDSASMLYFLLHLFYVHKKFCWNTNLTIIILNRWKIILDVKLIARISKICSKIITLERPT